MTRIARQCADSGTQLNRLRVALAIGLVFAAGSLSGCPLANGFFIRIQNDATDIAVTVIRLRDFQAEENVTANLLRTEVDGGTTRSVFVPLRKVASADALRIRVNGTNPQEPIGFAITRAITGGFAAGKTVTVTVTGSPTQSVDIEVEPS